MNISRPLDWALGGWQTSLIAFVSSGNPFDLSSSVAQPANRPDIVAPFYYPKSVSGYWFDPASFTSATIPTIRASSTSPLVWSRVGDFGRNQLYGPGNRTFNLSAQKNVHISDRFTLELHGDAFNVLNTPQFNNPGANVDDTTTFGKLTSVKLYTNRQIQLAARLTF